MKALFILVIFFTQNIFADIKPIIEAGVTNFTSGEDAIIRYNLYHEKMN